MDKTNPLRPRFTILRLLGGVAMIAAGCWGGTFADSESVASAIVVPAIGGGIGTLCHGPIGSFIGVTLTWITMVAILASAVVLMAAYELVS